MFPFHSDRSSAIKYTIKFAREKIPNYITISHHNALFGMIYLLMFIDWSLWFKIVCLFVS